MHVCGVRDDQCHANNFRLDAAGAADRVPCLRPDRARDQIDQSIEVRKAGAVLRERMDCRRTGIELVAHLWRHRLQSFEQSFHLVVNSGGLSEYEIERIREELDAARSTHFIPALRLDRCGYQIDDAVRVIAVLLLGHLRSSGVGYDIRFGARR